MQAEHRERLQDLQVRLSSLMERIAAEDASRIKWSDRCARVHVRVRVLVFVHV